MIWSNEPFTTRFAKQIVENFNDKCTLRAMSFGTNEADKIVIFRNPYEKMKIRSLSLFSPGMDLEGATGAAP